MADRHKYLPTTKRRLLAVTQSNKCFNTICTKNLLNGREDNKENLQRGQKTSVLLPNNNAEHFKHKFLYFVYNWILI